MMSLNCCGTCMYGKNENKYPGGSKKECMLDGYTPHLVSHCCNKFHRDFKKNAVITASKGKL